MVNARRTGSNSTRTGTVVTAPVTNEEVRAMLLGGTPPTSSARSPAQRVGPEGTDDTSGPTLYGRCTGCGGITPGLGSLMDVSRYWRDNMVSPELIKKVARILRKRTKHTVMLCCACAVDIDRLAKGSK
jgi:hypothetical protein